MWLNSRRLARMNKLPPTIRFFHPTVFRLTMNRSAWTINSNGTAPCQFPNNSLANEDRPLPTMPNSKIMMIAKPIIVNPATSYSKGWRPSFFFFDAAAFFFFFDFFDMLRLLLLQKGFPAVVGMEILFSVLSLFRLELLFHLGSVFV